MTLLSKKPFHWLIGVLAAVVMAAALSLAMGGRPARSESISQTGVMQTLIDLLNKQDRTKITADDYDSTSIKDIITFGTPAGYRVKLRYLNFGIALADALKIARDDQLRDRLIEMVQWTREPKVRAEAIMTLASLYNPAHKKYLKEALLDSKVGIRCAAVEAIQMWGQPQALSLLKMSTVRDWSPFMRIFSAQALLSLGDESGLPTLWAGLDDNSWVIRAMSARYLGDYADPKDYDKLVEHMNNETHNDFVLAECAIAALKLISKKGEKVSYSSASKGWRDNQEVGYAIGKDRVVDVEPLVIVPPRLHIPKSLQLAAQINTQLLRLLKERLDAQLDPVQAQDPVLQDLYSLATPTGFALMTRYSQLPYLLVEGLAGSNDPVIIMELQNLIQNNSNPLVRATALLALAYRRDKSDVYLIEDALRDKSALVRMGALEAVEVGRFEEAIPIVSAIAGTDHSPVIQVYAMEVLAHFGDAGGRNLIIADLNNPDWPARAMSYWFLGRYGQEDDYSIILSRLPVETNPFVQAEMCLALLRLAPADE